MLKLFLSLVVSVIAVLLIGPRVLPVLRKLKFGQSIYELGPKSHQVKQVWFCGFHHRVDFCFSGQHAGWLCG